METATEGGSYGLAVGLTLSFEFGETVVSRIAADLRQQGMLEVVLPVVNLGAGHCPVRLLTCGRFDNSVSSVTKMNLLSLRRAY